MGGALQAYGSSVEAVAIADPSVTLSRTDAAALFSTFKPWAGDVGAGRIVNFLGVSTRTAFFGTSEGKRVRYVETTWPAPDEEYFAWIDLLDGVTQADGVFTAVEIGAGWGRWLANAAAAAQARDLPFSLVGVEPEPTHFEWLKLHLRDNAVPDDAATLVEAALWARDGWVRFHIGAPRRWYGQAVAESPLDQPPPSALDQTRLRLARASRWSPRRVSVVRAVTLAEVMGGLDVVHFLHMDVQGVEASAIRAQPTALERVRCIHVRTHSAAIEAQLRDVFGELGWNCRNDYPSLSTSETPFGEIAFQDGVQTWINPVA